MIFNGRLAIVELDGIIENPFDAVLIKVLPDGTEKAVASFHGISQKDCMEKADLWLINHGYEVEE